MRSRGSILIEDLRFSDLHAAERQHSGRDQEPEVLPQTRGAGRSKGRRQRLWLHFYQFFSTTFCLYPPLTIAENSTKYSKSKGDPYCNNMLMVLAKIWGHTALNLIKII